MGKAVEKPLAVGCSELVGAADKVICGDGVELGAPVPLAAAAVRVGAGAAVVLGAAESLLLLLPEGCGEGEAEGGGEAVRDGADEAVAGADSNADPLGMGDEELLCEAAGEIEANADSVRVRVGAAEALSIAPVAVGRTPVPVPAGEREELASPVGVLSCEVPAERVATGWRLSVADMPPLPDTAALPLTEAQLELEREAAGDAEERAEGSGVPDRCGEREAEGQPLPQTLAETLGVAPALRLGLGPLGVALNSALPTVP